METIKRTVRVITEKEIEVEIDIASMGYETLDEYLKEFREGLWNVNGADDVAIYAAKSAAEFGSGYEHDGLGLLKDSDIGKAPNTIFTVNECDISAEII